MLGIAGIAFITSNVRGIVTARQRGSSFSRIPLLGGAFLTGALLLYPGLRLGPLASLPLVLDPGCFHLLIGVLVRAARKSHS